MKFMRATAFFWKHFHVFIHMHCYRSLGALNIQLKLKFSHKVHRFTIEIMEVQVFVLQMMSTKM